MDYESAVGYLFSLQKFGIKLGLNSTENLLKRIGDPHLASPVLHLAGSNGKGSVGAMAGSMLARAGRRVGFYTSPHLVSFRERFTINGRMIPEKEVLRLVKQILDVCEKEEPPTFFEFVTAMAFQYFKDEKVDIAILETGLGGRLDATNVCRPLVGVITNISLEHTEHLGRTLEKIAGEKAGIIKPGLDVITGEKRPFVRDIFQRQADAKKGRLFILGRDFKTRRRAGGRFDYFGLKTKLKNLETPLAGQHQVKNAALALAAIERLTEKGFNVGEEDMRQGLASVHWPARAEIIHTDGRPDIMLDGAHNPAAAKTLAAVLTELAGEGKYRNIHLVLGIMSDKDQRGIMGPLLPLAKNLFLTRPEYFRSADTGTLAAIAGEYNRTAKQVPSVSRAIETALKQAGKKDLVVITGSLFTVGEAQAALQGKTAPDPN